MTIGTPRSNDFWRSGHKELTSARPARSPGPCSQILRETSSAWCARRQRSSVDASRQMNASPPGETTNLLHALQTEDVRTTGPRAARRSARSVYDPSSATLMVQSSRLGSFPFADRFAAGVQEAAARGVVHRNRTLIAQHVDDGEELRLGHVHTHPR